MNDKCTKCRGSGWYEPKNMGGMMVEPCNRCDAGRAILNPHKAEKPKTPDKCPVCGCAEPSSTGKGYKCGGETSWSDCDKASDLAIERSAEIERLKAQLKAMADFFEDYTCLSEGGQAYVENEAERLIASARKTLTATKPQETT